MRIRCTEATRIKVAPNTLADLDAHHEYYLDDDQAQALIDKGKAVELDARGRSVEQKRTRKAADSKPPEQQATGPAGKPGSGRRTKATQPPENKSATEQTGPDKGATAPDGS